MPRLVVLVGLPYSGKTTLAARLAGLGWLNISQDGLGLQAIQLCKEALSEGCDVILDGCNYSMSERSVWVQIAKHNRATSCVLHLDTAAEVCLKRLSETVKGQDPTLRQIAFSLLASKLEPLALSEGFEEGFIARTAADIENFCYYIGSCSNSAATHLFQRRHQALSCHLGADQGPLTHEIQVEQPLEIEEPRPQDRSATEARPGKRARRTLRKRAEKTLKDHRDQMGRNSQLPGPQEQQDASDDLTCSSHESQQRQGKQQMKVTQVKWKPGLPESQSQPVVKGPCPEAARGPMRAWGQLPHFWPHLPPQQFPTSTEIAGTQYRANGTAHGHPPAHAAAMHRQPAMPIRQAESSGSAVDTVRPPLVPYDLQSPNNDRPVLLFDLNGTLTSHTAQRKSVGITKVRPGIQHLRRLASKYRLGIYTSSSERTTMSVLPMLEKSAGRGEPLFQEPQLILYRGHTQHATSEHKAAGGKDWDTVKPLSRYFASLGRVLLVDDDAYKAVPGEGGNMIVVPGWVTEDPKDIAIEALVNALLAATDGLPPGADLRLCTAQISQAMCTIRQNV